METEKVNIQLTPDEWMALGKPKQYIVAERYEDISLIEDISFGNLFLIRGKEVVATGRDFVKHEKFIGLSVYFTGDKARLYKEVG